MMLDSRSGSHDLRKALWLNLLLLVASVLSGSVLVLTLRWPVWGLLTILLGVVASQTLMSRTIRRADTFGLNCMVRAIGQVLDSQNDTIEAQKREIARLRSTLEGSPSQNAHVLLATRTGPDLIAVVERLCEAEESLPDLLPQTREWIARIRGQAVQAQSQVARLHGEHPAIHQPKLDTL